MTQLLDNRKTEKLKLPSFPDVEVEIYDGLLTGEYEAISKCEGEFTKGIEILKFLIKSWSFVDKDEKPLGISKESLNLLPVKDFTMLMNNATKALAFLVEEKKKSSNE